MDEQYLRYDLRTRLAANMGALKQMSIMSRSKNKEMGEIAELSSELLIGIYDGNVNRALYDRAIEICSTQAPDHEMAEYHWMMIRNLMNILVFAEGAIAQATSREEAKRREDEVNEETDNINIEEQNQYQESTTESINTSHCFLPQTPERFSVKREMLHEEDDCVVINEFTAQTPKPVPDQSRSVDQKATQEEPQVQNMERTDDEEDEDDAEDSDSPLTCRRNEKGPKSMKRKGRSSAKTPMRVSESRETSYSPAPTSKRRRHSDAIDVLNERAGLNTKEALTCPYCGEEFDSLFLHINHQHKVHGKDRLAIYGCSLCIGRNARYSRWCINLASARIHLQTKCLNGKLVQRSLEEAKRTRDAEPKEDNANDVKAEKDNTKAEKTTAPSSAPRGRDSCSTAVQEDFAARFGLDTKNALTCPYCGDEFSGFFAHSLHQENEHREERAAIYGCSQCSSDPEWKWWRAIGSAKYHFANKCPNATLLIRSVEEARAAACNPAPEKREESEKKAEAQATPKAEKPLPQAAILLGLSENSIDCPYCRESIKPSTADNHIRNKHFNERTRTFGCVSCNKWSECLTPALQHVLSKQGCEKVSLRSPDEARACEETSTESAQSDENQGGSHVLDQNAPHRTANVIARKRTISA